MDGLSSKRWSGVARSEPTTALAKATLTKTGTSLFSPAPVRGRDILVTDISWRYTTTRKYGLRDGGRPRATSYVRLYCHRLAGTTHRFLPDRRSALACPGQYYSESQGILAELFGRRRHLPHLEDKMNTTLATFLFSLQEPTA